MPELTTSKEAATLEKTELVEVVGTDGGSVQARLISNPAGTNDHYVDTRDENGKLVVGKKIDYVS